MIQRVSVYHTKVILSARNKKVKGNMKNRHQNFDEFVNLTQSHPPKPPAGHTAVDNPSAGC